MGRCRMTFVTDCCHPLWIVRRPFAPEIDMVGDQLDGRTILPFGACFLTAAAAGIIVSCKDISFDIFMFIHRSLLIHLTTDLRVFHVLDIKPSDLDVDGRIWRQGLYITLCVVVKLFCNTKG